MALDFPASATVGQIYTGTNGVLYTYDGVRWRATAAGETDPIYSTGTASTITGTNISFWNQAYSWGNHATRGYLTATVSQHILPSADLTYDLGSSSTQWRSLYVGTSTIYIGGTPLSIVDGQVTVGGQPLSISTLVNGTYTVSINTSGNLSIDGISQRLDFADTVSTIYAVDPDLSGGVSGLNLIGKDRLYSTIADSTGTWSYNWDFRSFGLNDYSTNSKPTMKFPGNGYLMTDFTTGFGQNRPVTLASSHHLNLAAGNNEEPGEYGGYVKLSSGLGDDGYGNVIIDTGNYEFTFGSNGKLVLNPVGHWIDPSVVGTLSLQSANTTTSAAWNFLANGILEYPAGTTSTGSAIYVPYATSSSFRITTEVDMGGGPYMPMSFEVQGDTTILPNGNGLIKSGPNGGLWRLDSANYSFSFPNDSDIEYGDGTYLSTGTLRVRIDYGGEFKIFLGNSNKTWTFNNSGNIVFPNGTEQATAFTGTNVITGTNDNFVISINTGTLTVRNQFTDSVVISSLGITGAINYVPTNPADWTGSPTVGTVSSAIDELAYRTTSLEAAGGGGGGTSDIADVWMYNNNSNLGVPANTITVVPFDNISGTGNVGTDWNTNSGFTRLEPSLGGWYDISCHVQWAGSWSANVSLMVYKNGNLYKNIGSSWIGQGGQQYGRCLVYLNGTGDYADIRVNQGSGGFQSIETGISKTWVQAFWVKG